MNALSTAPNLLLLFSVTRLQLAVQLWFKREPRSYREPSGPMQFAQYLRVDRVHGWSCGAFRLLYPSKARLERYMYEALSDVDMVDDCCDSTSRAGKKKNEKKSASLRKFLHFRQSSQIRSQQSIFDICNVPSLRVTNLATEQDCPWISFGRNNSRASERSSPQSTTPRESIISEVICCGLGLLLYFVHVSEDVYNDRPRYMNA